MSGETAMGEAGAQALARGEGTGSGREPAAQISSSSDDSSSSDPAASGPPSSGSASRSPAPPESSSSALAPAAPAPAAPRKFPLNWPTWLARWYTLYSKLVGLRFEGYPYDLEGPCIFTVWHSEEITLLPRFGFTEGAIMISNSKDGDILTKVVRHWGYPVIRGSSSKGAVKALMALKRTLDNGGNIIMAVDGPRGPRHQAKPGAFWLAAKTGRPICPLGAAVSRAHVFERSWSKSRLPLPFSKVAASFGDLVWLGKKDLELDSEARQAFLTEVMNKAMAAAERLLKTWPGTCSDCGKRLAGPG